MIPVASVIGTVLEVGTFLGLFRLTTMAMAVVSLRLIFPHGEEPFTHSVSVLGDPHSEKLEGFYLWWVVDSNPEGRLAQRVNKLRGTKTVLLHLSESQGLALYNKAKHLKLLQEEVITHPAGEEPADVMERLERAVEEFEDLVLQLGPGKLGRM